MNAPYKLILIILACLLFLLAGLGGPWGTAPDGWPYRGRLIAWGLFCWALSEIVR
jgi:hypothetical protein